jgi:hypothetical protein
MKTGVSSGTEYQKHENSVPLMTPVFMFSVLYSTDDTSFLCFRYSAPPMTPVFMFSVFCSTDDTSFYVFGILLHRWHQFSCFQIAENMKIGAISGAEYRKHKNWCHQWSRVQKT